jgi:hypothetical protein
MVSLSNGVVMKSHEKLVALILNVYTKQIFQIPYMLCNFIGTASCGVWTATSVKKVAVIMVCLITFPASRERVVQRDRQSCTGSAQSCDANVRDKRALGS